MLLLTFSLYTAVLTNIVYHILCDIVSLKFYSIKLITTTSLTYFDQFYSYWIIGVVIYKIVRMPNHRIRRNKKS